MVSVEERTGELECGGTSKPQVEDEFHSVEAEVQLDRVSWFLCYGT